MMNRSGMYQGQMQQMMQQQMQNQAQQDAMRRMQSQFAPMQNNQALMQTAPMQTPQMGGYQGMNPMAMAQMLRGRMGGMNRPPMPQIGNQAMANSFGAGINPNPQPFNVGLNPTMNRSAFVDFIKSLSGG
jgi:hypothetical protein